jgi:hypothetical protein
MNFHVNTVFSLNHPIRPLSPPFRIPFFGRVISVCGYAISPPFVSMILDFITYFFESANNYTSNQMGKIKSPAKTPWAFCDRGHD